MIPVTPELVVRAYAAGIFPMARGRDDPGVQWVDPDPRGILPLETFHVSRSLRKVLRRGDFHVTVDHAFAEVMAGCAEPTGERPDTWINDEIAALFGDLHAVGAAHSVEAWRHDRLAGGLYGLALNGAFFGESMFSRAPDASKVALAHLVARLRVGGFRLLDTQFVTGHLARFGAVEVSRSIYHELLRAALETAAHLPATLPAPVLDCLPARDG